MTYKVIFLDFDGVLNTEQYQTMLAAEGKKVKTYGGLYLIQIQSRIYKQYFFQPEQN